MRHPKLLSRDDILFEDETINSLQIGYTLLLHSVRGGFWAKIVDIHPRGYYDAMVFSRDLSGQTINFGDMIKVHKRHIHGIGIPWDLQN
jgi:hypothetical protein